MQTLNWYYQRLKVMSSGEIAWRIRSSLRDRTDRILVGHRQHIRKPSAFLNGDGKDEEPEFRLSNTADIVDKQWYDSLLTRANRIVDHRLDFFDLKDKYLGDPIIWNRDHKRDQDTPMTYCASLDYRDVEEAGDCKFVWEPNRHHQLVVLGRAWRLSGDIRFNAAETTTSCSRVFEGPTRPRRGSPMAACQIADLVYSLFVACRRRRSRVGG